MNRCFLVRWTAGLFAVSAVGLAVAQTPPKPCETCPFPYYTHRCSPHYNQGKFCVPEVTTKKKSKAVYCFKEIDYCYPKQSFCCGCFLRQLFPCLFPKAACACKGHPGCSACNRVRTKRVLLKKTIPCEQLRIKCRVEYMPCVRRPFDPTRKAEKSSEPRP